MPEFTAKQEMILDILESSTSDIARGGLMVIMLEGGHIIEGVVSFIADRDNHGSIDFITKGMSPSRGKEVEFHTTLPIDNIIAVRAEFIPDGE